MAGEADNQAELLKQKIKQCLESIPDHQAMQFQHRESKEFSRWLESSRKWLRFAGPVCAYEHERFQALQFRYNPTVWFSGADFSQENYSKYRADLETAGTLLESALENLELGIVPSQADLPAPQVQITNLQTLNVALQHVTLTQLMEHALREAESKTQDPAEKQTLRQKWADLTQNQTFASVVGSTLGEVLKGVIGVWH